MIRGRAASLARFKREHPRWWARREEDGTYIAGRGTTMIAAQSLERLAYLADRAGPGRDDDEDED